MFELPELTFADSALEPYISGETIHYHHGRHHRAYVGRLNTLLAGTEFVNLSIAEFMGYLGTHPGLRDLPEGEQVRFAALQHFNHSLMWTLLSPVREEPPEPLVHLLLNKYDTWENFENSFLQAANKLIGSGWVYLTLSRDGSLDIVALPNGDNPILTGGDPRAILVICDLWEHAYYLDHQDDKESYIRAFLKVVDWRAVLSQTLTMSAFYAKDRF